MIGFRSGLALLLVLAAAPALSQERILFDGISLKGWTVLGNGSWTVQEGAIVAKLARQDPQFTHLVFDSVCADFRAAFKFRHAKGNAGFFFRMERKDATPAGVSGLQAVIEPSLPAADAMGLYETNGRGWVRKWDYPAKAGLYKAGDWNDLAVTAIGTRILVELNGSELVLLPNDAAGRREGRLAFKLHGGQDVEIRFKDVRLAPAGASDIAKVRAAERRNGPGRARVRPDGRRIPARLGAR